MIRKKFQLADRRFVTLEDLKEEDLPELVQVLNSVIQEGQYLLMEEEIIDLEIELQWYHDHMKAGMTYLIARVDGEIVGGASIEPKKGKESHVLVYGIFIKDGFRNLGIGTQLTKALIEIARQHCFRVMELSVFGSNQRAFQVYKKCGFQEVGKIKDGFRLPDGTYTDKIIMILPLK